MFWTHPSKLPTAEGFFMKSPYWERARVCVGVIIVEFWFYKKILVAAMVSQQTDKQFKGRYMLGDSFSFLIH